MSIPSAPIALESGTSIFTSDNYAFTPYEYTLSSTSSSASPAWTGDDTYPVFPNANYISRFYHTPDYEAGLTILDQELNNYCYLPYNSAIHTYDKRQASSTSTSTSTPTPRPTYLIDEAPCKRQSSINANCYFQNTNRTFAGLIPYSDPQLETALTDQQTCYCRTYPFLDSVLGCQACFEQHGGIEGHHWFPSEYVSAVSRTYCAAPSLTTDFYGFVRDWASTQTEVQVGSTTASNVLGTETSMEAYYTYNITIPSSSTSTKNSIGGISANLAWTACALLAFHLLSNTVI
ncbi:hypothetical protein PMZ80_004420 [Knufia obscura]|uniref:Uncharacterized protein n=2 Tax=Knufia TaxID=430999 RepID=A0AAN8ET69_9EURO|nr:hypothetical protein PMZ80_004420 [Knufia obscura]KAK5951703.1 hypothetical protein OHC33_007382 [Knufia fluminis]